MQHIISYNQKQQFYFQSFNIRISFQNTLRYIYLMNTLRNTFELCNVLHMNIFSNDYLLYTYGRTNGMYIYTPLMFWLQKKLCYTDTESYRTSAKTDSFTFITPKTRWLILNNIKYKSVAIIILFIKTRLCWTFHFINCTAAVQLERFIEGQFWAHGTIPASSTTWAK